MIDVLVVYQPNPAFNLKRRFFVSLNQLDKYITAPNANKAITAAKNLKTNKTTLKFRKFGKIEIYLK